MTTATALPAICWTNPRHPPENLSLHGVPGPLCGPPLPPDTAPSCLSGVAMSCSSGLMSSGPTEPMLSVRSRTRLSALVARLWWGPAAPAVRGSASTHRVLQGAVQCNGCDEMGVRAASVLRCRVKLPPAGYTCWQGCTADLGHVPSAYSMDLVRTIA
jgi:hypothetical protein